MADTTLVERVQGMTCRSCEVLIEREVRALDHVRSVSADARKGLITLEVTGTIDRTALAHLLSTHDYVLDGRDPWFSRERQVWRDVATSAVALAVVLIVATALGLDSALGAATSSPSVGLLVPLIVGLAAGVSTCMATVGGLVLAISAQHASRVPAPTRREELALHLTFNAARIGGFVSLGAITGAVGSLVSISGTALAVAMVIAAVVMTVIGIRLTGLSPRIASLSPTLPTWATPWLTRNATGRNSASGRAVHSTRRATVLGVASFFVPCGFTQAMQVYALSTGDPRQAGLIMGVFALGTAPALLSLAGVPLLARGRHRERLLRYAGVMVIGFAVMNVSLVTGPVGSIPLPAPESTLAISDNVRIVDGVQIMTMTIDGIEYSPQHSVVYQGMPVQWEVDANGLTCASALVAPSLGVPPDTIVWPGETSTFTFTLDQPGAVEFACSMRMYFGSVTAIAPPPPADA
jgi:sulfite exporter TauE/SafE/copper chaperone CopZ